MPNHVAIAGLVVDVAGAVVLTRALAFQRAEQYARENPAALYPRSTDLERDVGRARDVADAQAGAILLFLGFIGQAIGAWGSWSCATALVAYVVAVIVIAAVVATRGRLARGFEGQLYVARVSQEFQHWHDSAGRQSRRAAQENYRRYLAAHDREAELDRWAEQAKRVVGVDPRAWEQSEEG